MSHRKPRPKPQSAPDAQPVGSHGHFPSSAAIRETVESIVIAFVLAFLFRTFEAEAFVIPTGSMAPTLMGRHKDVLCPKCGCPYQVSASEEVDQDGARRHGEGVPIETGTCPMCRYTASLGKDPSYNGDRILVGKLSYDFHQPQRWDVIVFKYPGNAPTNFIKRLVGLPGETVRIRNGNIWIQSREDNSRGRAGFTIARKPPEKLLAMLQPVFDNDYMARIVAYGWPARWYSDSTPPADGATGAWTSEDSTTFSADGASADENWLRYHHLTPSYQQWREAEARPSSVPQPAPQLITDFTAYDTGRNQRDVFVNPVPDPNAFGAHWVGDLAVACTVEVESRSGELAFELCKGGRRFQCRFDLSTGRATLSISGRDMQHWRPTALTGVRGRGRHDVLFSNCDDELLLWVDGGVVSFDAPTRYDDLGNTRPDATDLAPVGVASAGARVKISRLRVFRDIYYVAMREDAISRHISDYDHVDFPLGPDQYFVLGDNSAKSKDGRLWGAEYWVGRELLIGKALLIYWPHSWNKIPYVNVPFPYFPNFSQMGLVR